MLIQLYPRFASSKTSATKDSKPQSTQKLDRIVNADSAEKPKHLGKKIVTGLNNNKFTIITGVLGAMDLVGYIVGTQKGRSGATNELQNKGGTAAIFSAMAAGAHEEPLPKMFMVTGPQWLVEKGKKALDLARKKDNSPALPK